MLEVKQHVRDSLWRPPAQPAAERSPDRLEVRALHKHAVYCDGQYGQQPVAMEQCMSHRPQRCNDHAYFDSEGMPFPTEHSHGLMLHDANIIEMNRAEGARNHACRV